MVSKIAKNFVSLIICIQRISCSSFHWPMMMMLFTIQLEKSLLNVEYHCGNQSFFAKSHMCKKGAKRVPRGLGTLFITKINPSVSLPFKVFNRVPKCDVMKILFLEYFNFGSGF